MATMRLASLRLEPPHEAVELGYVEWGAAGAARTVVCVHGLTRNARDFDVLAEALAGRGARVLCVDVVGRGRSSWLDDPQAYAVPTYVAQLAGFLRQLGLERVDWVGTSMGGIIGMALAAAEASPVERLVLNDIGPFVPRAALAQLAGYLGLDLRFGSLEELEAHLRSIHAGFGPLSDAQWRHLAEHSARETENGWRLAYDPRIRVPFAAAAEADIELWALWDAIRCPVLVLHGAESPILLEPTILEMQRRGPRAEVVRFPGVGHAPALMSPDQVLAVERWLKLAGPAPAA